MVSFDTLYNEYANTKNGDVFKKWLITIGKSYKMKMLFYSLLIWREWYEQTQNKDKNLFVGTSGNGLKPGPGRLQRTAQDDDQ